MVCQWDVGNIDLFEVFVENSIERLPNTINSDHEKIIFWFCEKVSETDDQKGGPQSDARFANDKKSFFLKIVVNWKINSEK